MSNLTKDALLNAYNTSVAENGETHALTTKIRFAIMQHFTELRDAVTASQLQPITVDTREAVDFSDFYKKKALTAQPSTVAVLQEADIIPETGEAKENAFSPDNLKEMATKSAEDLLKDLGIEKLRAASTALGYKISHQMAHLKFAEKFLEALNISLTA